MSFSLELISSHLRCFFFLFFVFSNNNFKNFLILNRMGKRNSIKMIPISPRNQSISNARLLLLNVRDGSDTFLLPSPYPRLHSASCYLVPSCIISQTQILRNASRANFKTRPPTWIRSRWPNVKRRRRAPLVRVFPIKTDDSVC